MSNPTPIRAELPARLSALQTVLRQCVDILENQREQEIYAFAWYEEKQTLAAEAKRTMATTATSDRGVVFRLMCNNIQYEIATNNIEESNLIAKAKALREKVDNLCPSTTVPAYAPTNWQNELAAGLPSDIRAQISNTPTAATPVHFSPLCQDNPTGINIDTLINQATKYRDQTTAVAEAINKEHPEYKPLADVQIVVRFRISYYLFVDREKNMSQALPLSMLVGAGVTTAGQMARVVKGGLGTLELVQLSDSEQNTLAQTPQELSVAERLKPGRYQVITGPALSGIIAHEAFGHTQEGDTWMKGRSIAKALRESETRVGNDQATIVNNPALYSMEDQNAGSNGSYYFDNEGQLARPQTILDKGMLSAPMTDLTSSQKLNVARTANGKRESWRRPLMARQTNTYFTPGDKSLDELISMVNDGYLAVAPNGGMEDPKGGSLTAGTGYFEEIKNGKLTGKKLIGPSGGHIELTDSVFDMLDRITAKTAVSQKDNIPPTKLGGCGKYHKELVDAGVGGPYILWNSVACG